MIITGIAALVALLLWGGVRFLDTDRGRALIVRALPLYAPKSGLTLRAGRIDGWVGGRLRIRDLTLGDPAGVFAVVPLVDLDWRPFELLDNRLTVRSATAATATLLRRPRLRPSADPRILPDIDLVVGRLAIDRLVLAAPVTGSARVVALAGSADVRRGRALVALTARALAGGDAFSLRLDAEPDRDRFDLAARVAAPAGGIVARLLGLSAPLAVNIAGDGTWSAWRGTATARLGGADLAGLALTAAAGKFVAAGRVSPARLLRGAGARLTGPAMAVRLDARLDKRVVTASLGATSPALRLTAGGGLDLGTETFRAVVVRAALRDPAAFNPRLRGRDIRLAATLSGGFARPRIDYILTSPEFAWGRTGFTGFRAAGIVAAGSRPLTIPVVATAARVTGVGDDIAPLLAGLRIAGPLTLAGGQLASDTLAVRTARIAGTATLRLDTLGGAYDVGLDGRLPGYTVGTLGVADIAARLRALPDSGGGTRVTGTVRAQATRLDTALFRRVLAGLPLVTTAIDVAPDLAMRFTGLQLAAPGLTLTGGGTRAPGGIVTLNTRGASRDYGPAVVDLTGPLDRPQVDLGLAAPGFGLTGVSARVTPAAAGWSVVATGGSPLGPASARGLIGGDGAIDLDAAVAGLTGRGRLVPDAAGLVSGRVVLAGTGVGGSLVLVPENARQRADLVLTASRASLATVPATTIARGALSARVVLGDTPMVSGTFSLADLRTRGVTLTAASGSLTNDSGRRITVLTASGVAGAAFTAKLDASATADRVEVGGTATVAGQRLALDHAARFDRSGATWRLAPVTLVTGDGRVMLSGSVGETVSLDARLDSLGLSLLQLVDPTYDFGGRASGTIALTLPPNDAPPAGALSLRVAGLTRAGLAAASLPVDVAVNAILSPAAASARAVVVRGGATLGRVQAELRLGQGGFVERLLAAPLFAQARYAGPAQALWLLSGVDALDVRGPVTIAVDVGGRLGDPVLTGTIASSGARVESATLGTVVDNIRLDGRFAGSRLELTGFSGTVGKDGKVAGSGGIDLSAERGFPLDAVATLDNAEVLGRDDLRATASGTLRLRRDRTGGRIAGALTIARARYRIGRAAATDVAVLPVTERNVEVLGRTAPRAPRTTGWLLDVTATARDDLDVVGLGLDSQWRGELRLTGPATAPEISGRVRLVRGDYDFAGKRFALTRGDVRFAGGNPPDPVIDIAAENTSSGFTAQLALTGTALRPDIKFGSTPALPEDEVLSRVLFGASITTLSAPEAVQLAGALTQLRGGGGGLNPIDAVRKTLRIDRLRVLPADLVTGRKTSIAAGQYIGRRLYVELSTDAQGYSASAIEVSLSRSLSILSDVATLGGTSVNLRLKKDY